MKNSDQLAFWKKYELINSTNTINPIFGEPRICRFCKMGEPKTTFKMVAHVLPELLGTNNIISFDECDTCNQRFSAYESHLSKFLMPYLTMIGVEGKRGVPQFHSRTVNGNEATRTIVRNDEQKREVIISDLEDYSIDKEKNRMSLTFRKPPHIPNLVFKALVKIGLSLVPLNEFKEFDKVCNWLLDDNAEVSTIVTCCLNILTYKKFSHPYAELYKARRILFGKSFVPEYTLVIGFANIILQIFLPLSTNQANQKIDGKRPVLELYPGFVFDDLSRKLFVSFSFIDLIEKQTITTDQQLHFIYRDADFGIQPNSDLNG